MSQSPSSSSSSSSTPTPTMTSYLSFSYQYEYDDNATSSFTKTLFSSSSNESKLIRTLFSLLENNTKNEYFPASMALGDCHDESVIPSVARNALRKFWKLYKENLLDYQEKKVSPSLLHYVNGRGKKVLSFIVHLIHFKLGVSKTEEEQAAINHSPCSALIELIHKYIFFENQALKEKFLELDFEDLKREGKRERAIVAALFIQDCLLMLMVGKKLPWITKEEMSSLFDEKLSLENSIDDIVFATEAYDEFLPTVKEYCTSFDRLRSFAKFLKGTPESDLIKFQLHLKCGFLRDEIDAEKVVDYSVYDSDSDSDDEDDEDENEDDEDDEDENEDEDEDEDDSDENEDESPQDKKREREEEEEKENKSKKQKISDFSE